ncbi:transposase domain-containing protein, partial [Escherichia coli]|uniref:transposase domain-containing protein n=2 Tax=Enterobacteriaceae TaxID=543 RepID=UPI000A96D87C
DSWPGRAFLPLIPASALRFLLVAGKAGTCRLNGIDPEAYLRHILSILPEWPSNRVDELLPWNVVLTNK